MNMDLAVIFDMDGVLIDSQPLHYEIDIQVLKTVGYTADLATVAQYTGMSNPDRWPKYKENLGLKESAETLIDLCEATVREVFGEAKLEPIKDIPALLGGIKAMGLPCGVASSSSHELIQLVLNQTGIGQFFDFIVSGEDVKAGKPEPEIYLVAAEKAGREPGKCIAVEDAPAGILAAKNAGFTCIAFNNPNTMGQDFTHADYIVRKFDECFPIIQTLMYRGLGGKA